MPEETTTAAEAVQQASDLFSLFHHFVPLRQRAVLVRLSATGEEREFYRAKVAELVETARTMPRTYNGDGVARLHYFSAGCDWWITEADGSPDGRQAQAFGLADLGHGEVELGYISIEELTRHPAVELDLYWTPRPVAEIQAEREQRGRQ